MSTEVKQSIHRPALEPLFGKPPLLLNESKRAYDELNNATQIAMDPKNAMEKILVDDVVYLTWELIQARKQKAGLINATWKEATRMLLEALLTGDPVVDRLEAQGRADAYFTDAGQQWVAEFLGGHGLTIDAIAAQAAALRRPELEFIDRQMERARVSRMAIARDYTYHRDASSWKGPKDLLEIVDAKANEMSLVPAADPAAGES